MRSEGTVVGGLSVCLSVTLNLTSGVFVRLTNDTTYLTGDEGQKIKKTAPLQSKSASTIVRLMGSQAFLSLRKTRMRLYFQQPQPGPLVLCILKAQEVTTKGVYRLSHAIYYCS